MAIKLTSRHWRVFLNFSSRGRQTPTLRCPSVLYLRAFVLHALSKVYVRVLDWTTQTCEQFRAGLVRDLWSRDETLWLYLAVQKWYKPLVFINLMALWGSMISLLFISGSKGSKAHLPFEQMHFLQQTLRVRKAAVNKIMQHCCIRFRFLVSGIMQSH